MPFFYVDFSKPFEGDGLSQATAFNTFIGKDFQGLTVWVRRFGTMSLTSSLLNGLSNGQVAGWPIAGDDYNNIKPADPQNWDADTDTHPTILDTVGNIIRKITLCHRMKFYSSYQGNGTTIWCTALNIGITDTGGEQFNSIKFCIFKSVGQIACKTELHKPFQDMLNYPNPIMFRKCVFETENNAGGPAGTCFSYNPTDSPRLYDCNFHVFLPAFSNSRWVNFFLTESEDALGSVATFVRCQFFTNGDCYNPMILNGTEASAMAGRKYPVVFTNCLFDNSGCGGATKFPIRFAGSMMLKNCRHIGSGIDLEPLTDHGGAHFSQYSQTIAMPFGFQAFGEGTVLLNNPTFAANTTANIRKSPGVRLHMYNGSVASFSGALTNIFLRGENNTTNTFRYIDLGGEVEHTSSVLRTGSDSLFSLKLNYNHHVSIKRPLQYGQPNFERIFAKLKNGVTQTITLYGSFKNTTYTDYDFWAEIVYKNSSTKQQTAVSTRRYSVSLSGSTISRPIGSPVALTTDSSIWTGDTGLTSFKIIFSLTDLNIVEGLWPIRVGLSKYDASGLIYIDPKVLVA